MAILPETMTETPDSSSEWEQISEGHPETMTETMSETMTETMTEILPKTMSETTRRWRRIVHLAVMYHASSGATEGTEATEDCKHPPWAARRGGNQYATYTHCMICRTRLWIHRKPQNKEKVTEATSKAKAKAKCAPSPAEPEEAGCVGQLAKAVGDQAQAIGQLAVSVQNMQSQASTQHQKAQQDQKEIIQLRLRHRLA